MTEDFQDIIERDRRRKAQEEWRDRVAEESARDAAERRTPKNMRNTPDVTELHIPDESYQALTAVCAKWSAYATADVDAIARPVLIAYLREKAARGFGPADVMAEWVDELEAEG